MIEGYIIIGVGGTCVDVVDIIEDIRLERTAPPCLGFLDDDATVRNRSFAGLNVLGALKDARSFPDARFVFGIGSATNFWRRKEILAQTGLDIERFATLIHPTARISRTARLGSGVVVFPGAVIHSSSTLGDHVLVLSNALIGHDCRIGDHVIIAGGAQLAGGVTLADATYIGANATVLGGCRIGRNSLVGAGSVVCRSVAEEQVVVGVPARILRNINRK